MCAQATRCQKQVFTNSRLPLKQGLLVCPKHNLHHLASTTAQHVCNVMMLKQAGFRCVAVVASSTFTRASDAFVWGVVCEHAYLSQHGWCHFIQPKY